MSWKTHDSAELYGVPYWGRNLYHVNDAGHLVATPAGPGKGDIDLHEVTEELLDRGVELPVLLRMPQVAQRRLESMGAVFAQAIETHSYTGRYRGVYPVKVNQQRPLVEDILSVGDRLDVGLEAGSKPELLIALAMMNTSDGLLICNGYKDAQYIETALMGSTLGHEVFIVVEKLSELPIILEVAERTGIRPRLGVRAKLSNPGKGRWQSSAGDRAKFGLSALDIVRLVERLKAADALDCLQLLHFHIGSQVTSMQTFKRAVREATRLYVELHRMGAPMGTMDVGGGLGVDYDGSKTDYESSRNYDDLEYASDVIDQAGAACNAAGVPHPDIVTESGRSTVAHCSVLLFDILGAERLPVEGPPPPETEDEPALIAEMRGVYHAVSARRYQECWHDAIDVRTRAHQGFELGVLNLQELARVDELFWRVCGRVRHVAKGQSYVPDDLDGLEPALADTYYGNFSVFQSAPDAWAIGQLFPCMPIHRLDEEPTRRAVIADLTCDSDGKLAQFVDRRDVKKVLELHTLREGERYVVALALVGAYQEILGDMHNLFGDTHAVHLTVDAQGRTNFELVVEGDTVEQVTSYVQYSRKDLVNRMRSATERAIRAGTMDRKAAAGLLALYRRGLDAYTYLQG